MGNEEPMYTVNLKKIPKSKQHSKRPPPVPLHGKILLIMLHCMPPIFIELLRFGVKYKLIDKALRITMACLNQQKGFSTVYRQCLVSYYCWLVTV